MKHLALIAVLLLAACGWKPMYGDLGKPEQNSTAEARLDQIEISMIPDAEGVYLRNALIDRFYKNGYPVSPLYHLSFGKLIEQKSDFDITVESETTRRQLRLKGRLKLVDLQTREAVLERDLVAVTSFNVLGSEFATRVSEADAREAALNDLARQTELQLSLYFNR